MAHNQSADLSAEFGILVLDNAGDLFGCMAVKQPLVGSGPLAGRVLGSDVSFVVTSPIGKITFVGLRDNTNISGTYAVDRGSPPLEKGTFVIAKMKSEIPASYLQNQKCPTDAEVHANGIAFESAASDSSAATPVQTTAGPNPSPGYASTRGKPTHQPTPKYRAMGRVSCYANERLTLYTDETLTKVFRTLGPGESIYEVGTMGDSIALTFAQDYILGNTRPEYWIVADDGTKLTCAR